MGALAHAQAVGPDAAEDPRARPEHDQARPQHVAAQLAQHQQARRAHPIVPWSEITTSSLELTSPRKRPSIRTGSWKTRRPETLTLRPTATRVRSSTQAAPGVGGMLIVGWGNSKSGAPTCVGSELANFAMA
jgi:hypothetical protein